MTVTATTLPKTIRVMVVDDSALMRKLLAQLLARSPEIEIIDTAMDGQFALDHLRRVRPDVILMDIDMPRLDGLAALDRIVAEYSLPVVMCSTRTTAGGQATIEALARGAVDFIEKPSVEALTSGEAAAEIISRVRGAVGARVVARRPPQNRPQTVAPLTAAPAPISGNSRATIEQIKKFASGAMPELIAIGTSTGGPPALEQVLAALPGDFPLGIVIVQHMPAGFTAMLADHLNLISKIEIREAVNGETVRPGVALIAPGGAHLRVVQAKGHYVVTVDTRGPLISGHRPSVDALFESLVTASRGHVAAVIMTGMGSDGAPAMAELHAQGGRTIAEAEETAIVWGMPGELVAAGGADWVLPLPQIAGWLRKVAP